MMDPVPKKYDATCMIDNSYGYKWIIEGINKKEAESIAHLRCLKNSNSKNIDISVEKKHLLF